MDATIKAKWVATLRSGNYQQGSNYLRDNKNRCCCLGVLCDIVEPRGWRKSGFVYGHHLEQRMPDHINRRVGLRKELAISLAMMNDQGSSFAEIADWIEQNV